MNTDLIVKHALTQWANREQLPEIKEIIQGISVESSSTKNLVFLRVDSLKEERHLKEGQESVNAGDVSEINKAYKVFSPETFNVWDSKLHELDSFESFSQEYRIDNSTQAEICSNCHGHGTEECSTCNGKGSNTCNNCGGSGDVYCNLCGGTGKCSNCNGYGYNIRNEQRIDEHRDAQGTLHRDIYYVDVKEDCHHCRSGECDCGNGFLICPVCNGSGEVTCNPCSGSGSITCSCCNGYGGVAAYYYLQQHYTANQKVILPQYEESLAPYGNLSAIRSNGLTKDLLIEETIIESHFSTSAIIDRCRTHSTDFEIDCTRVEKELKAMIDLTYNQVLRRIKTSYYSKPIVELQYTLEKQSYLLMIDPVTLLCYYQKSPIDDYLSQALKEVDHLLESKEKTLAYHRLLRLKEVETSNSNEIIAEKYASIEMKLKKAFSNMGLFSYLLVFALQYTSIPLIGRYSFGFFSFIIPSVIALVGFGVLIRFISSIFHKMTQGFLQNNITHRFAYEMSAAALFGLISFLVGVITHQFIGPLF